MVDDQGHILARLRRDTPAQNPGEVEALIADAIRELATDHEIEAAGLGAAGWWTPPVHRAVRPQPAWQPALRAAVEQRTGLPVVVENDANAPPGARPASGRPHDLMLEGRPCGCGNADCWEQYASGRALVTEARQRAAASLAEAGPATAPGHRRHPPGGHVGCIRGRPRRRAVDRGAVLLPCAPARRAGLGARFLPELIDLIWNRQIDPGRVFDLSLPLEQAAEGYRRHGRTPRHQDPTHSVTSSPTRRRNT